MQRNTKHYRLVLANGEVFDDVVIRSTPGGASFYVIDVYDYNKPVTEPFVRKVVKKQLHVRREFIGYFEDDAS